MTSVRHTRVGVVGLLADMNCDKGLVTPLVAEVAHDWLVAPNLPFTATELQRALQMILSSGPLPTMQPDFFGFRVADRLGQKSYGSSMTVAGLLAVIDADNNSSCQLLDTAVAVVESADKDKLRPVKYITQKLRAFERELGYGTLFVRAKQCPEAEVFDHLFQTVWRVDSWAELAQLLEAHGLLAVFKQGSPLDRHKLRKAIERLSVLCAKQSHYRQALELAKELASHPVGPDVTPADLHEVQQWTIDLYRHLGRYRDACQNAMTEHRRLRSESIDTSYDQQARATAVYAASLYDLHCFDDICHVLTPWCRRLTKHPLIVAPLTRVMVYNTLARAMVVTRSTGWESHYYCSLKILSEIDPFDRGRTYNYLLHGLLREGRLDEAEQVVCTAQSLPAISEFSKWMLGFGRADLACRRSTIWSDPELDAVSESNEISGHALGFYLQATARQPGRSLGDSTQRFERARQLFLHDVISGDTDNILLFLAECMNLAMAAWNDDSGFWKQSTVALQDYVSRQTIGGFAEYYEYALPSTDSYPSVEATEQLLRRVPYL